MTQHDPIGSARINRFSHERFSWTVLVYPLNSLLVPSHFSIETRPRRWQQMSLRCAGILLSLLISPGLAFPAHLPSHHTKRREDVNFLNFQPKGPNDVRSPCPAMNALANHNVLPHSGRNITIEMVVQACAAINVGADFCSSVGDYVLADSPNPSRLYLDLDDLDRHGVIEHDFSLSRVDAYFGNVARPDAGLINQLLSFAPVDTWTLEAIGKARYARVIDSISNDPNVTYTNKEMILSYGEAALLLSILSDPINGPAPASFVSIFFQEERFPFVEGWRPPILQINWATIAAMGSRIQAASPVDENVIITEETVKTVFSGSEGSGEVPCQLGGAGCEGLSR